MTGPYEGLTDSTTVVADKLMSLLNDNKDSLGIKDIFYGDQDRIPRNPAVCIETGEKTRELTGAPRGTTVTIPVYLLVYHNGLKAGAAGQRRDNDLMAEQIEAFIHNYPTLEEIVVHCYCTALEPGYIRKRDAIWQVTRITVEATSKVQLPNQFT